MDQNLFQNIDFFAAPAPGNAQATNAAEKVDPSNSSTAPASGAAPPDPSLWGNRIGADAVLSESPSTGPSGGSLGSFAQPSTLPSSLSLGSLSGRSQVGQSRSAFPSGNAPSPDERRKKDRHDRKRAKLTSETPALESVDYWIHFDDDDPDKGIGESFEIDFSKRRNNPSKYRRPLNAVDPLPTTPGLGTGLYATSTIKEEDFVDDSALDNALSDDEDLLDSLDLGDYLSKIDSKPPSEVPQREGLYSTPLSWERPQPGLGAEPLQNIGGFGGFAGMGGLGRMNIGTPILTPEEQRRLLTIAMGGKGIPTGFTAGFAMPFGTGFGTGFGMGQGTGLDFGDQTTSLSQISKPTQSENELSKGKSKASSEKQSKSQVDLPPPPRPQLQRTQTGSSDKGKEKEKQGEKEKGKATDRTTHNDIERKYRTNLKDRIAELRDAIPALKAIPDEAGSDGEGGSSSQPATKVSKGTILTKATEYIHHLEKKNKTIMKEHQELARRLQAFEQLLNASAMQPFLMPNHSRTLFDPRGFC